MACVGSASGQKTSKSHHLPLPLGNSPCADTLLGNLTITWHPTAQTAFFLSSQVLYHFNIGSNLSLPTAKSNRKVLDNQIELFTCSLTVHGMKRP
jgi:hypothetical protein